MSRFAGHKHTQESKSKISASLRKRTWQPRRGPRKLVSKPCEVCERLIQGTPGRVARQKYCSRGCNNRARGRKMPCTDCGADTSRLGVKRCRKCFAIWFRGSNGSQWRGGVSTLNNIERGRVEYRQWRTAVFERDNYTCVFCGKRGGKLNADHIKPFALFKELRLEISNGRTLCEPCHRKTDTWGNRRALAA